MSNQIVITSGAKVRNLSGVLTATSGVVDSVGFGTANGVATLDSNGKVPLSQLPASVVTYLGTWNAATNTPTLANGTGDVGDLYICNVAGTVNFGAGPITFAVGDWVIYNGSQWQKSAGSSGTVTSVAMTVPTGLSVTGSPITTSGTLAVSLSSGYTIPTTSFLAGLVPYTGATTDVDLGAHVLNAQSLHVKGTAGAGHLGLKHQSAAATGTANESLIYANVDGDLAWQNDNLYLTTLNTHANTANRVYTFPNASGTIALTSDISYPVTSVFGRTGAVTAQSGDYTTTQVTEGTNLYYTDARARGAISLTTTGTSGAATYNSTTGVLNIPNYSETTFGTVTSVGLSSATSGVTIGSSPITTSGTITLAIATASGSQQGLLSSTDWTTFNGKQGAITLTTTGTSGAATLIGNTLNIPNYAPDLSNYVTLNTSQTITGSKTFNAYILSSAGSGNQATIVANISTLHSGSSGVNGFGFNVNNNIYFGKGLDNGGVFSWNNTTVRYYTLPDATGTIALTSDIPSLSGYVQGSGTTNYLPKFTASGTIGNSSIIDNGSITAYTNAFTIYQTGGTGAAFYLSGGGTDSVMSSITSSSTYQNLNLLASTLAFYTGTLGGLSTTERMRITPTGNVGIGTSSPTSKLYVLGDTSNYGITSENPSGYGGLTLKQTSGNSWSLGVTSNNLFFYDANGGATRMTITSSGNVGIGTSSPTSFSGYTTLSVNNSSQGGIVELQSNGTSALRMACSTSDSALWEPRSVPVLFATANTERMRITSGGTVSIGSSSPSGDKLYVQGSSGYWAARFDGAAVTNSSFGVAINAGTTSGDNAFYIRSFNASSVYLNVRGDGYLSSPPTYNNTYGNAANMYIGADGFMGRSTSSLKYKENVIDYTKGLAEVMQLRPVSYTSKNPQEEGQTFAGLIAEEVHDLGLTEFVQYAEDGSPDALAYTHMIALLTKAIQEQQAQIEELKALINK